MYCIILALLKYTPKIVKVYIMFVSTGIPIFRKTTIMQAWYSNITEFFENCIFDHCVLHLSTNKFLKELILFKVFSVSLYNMACIYSIYYYMHRLWMTLHTVYYIICFETVLLKPLVYCFELWMSLYEEIWLLIYKLQICNFVHSHLM